MSAYQKAERRQALGDRLRELRRNAGLTLKTASGRTGLATSTLSKIENGQMSPTYDNLVRVAEGYKVDIEELFTRNAVSLATARYAITRRNEGRVVATAQYQYEMLCTSVSHKRITPIVATVKRRKYSGPADLAFHSGEEMFYVLEGAVELHLEHYEPITLEVGDCAYFDSTMGHALISSGEGEARVLWVCTHTLEQILELP